MRRTLLLLIVSVLAFAANAQIVDPVTWNYKVNKTDKNTAELIIEAKIESGWYLYGQDFASGGPVRTNFTFDESEHFELVGKTEPTTKPKKEYDEIFQMDVTKFSDKATFKQKVKLLTEKSFTITGNTEYQVCQDEKCVYFNPDFTFTIEGEGEVSDKTAGQEEENQPQLSKSGDKVQMGDQKDTENEKAATMAGDSDEEEQKSLVGFFLFSVLLGLAGILTPCVFPMIPMTVSFFMQGQSSKLNSIIKALIFGLSIIILYTAVGVIVSLTSAGADLTTTLSTHWIPNLIFFVLFLVFAASFFGMFEIVLPSGLANKADKQVDKGGMLASFFMALTLVIVSFSCTGPIVGALLVKAAGGAVIEPTIGMLGFGLGFGLPFTVLAISPGWLKKLPQSGGWMNAVKVFLAFIILAFSLKFLSNIDQSYHLNLLSRDLYIAIWITLFALLGLYLLGKFKLPHDSDAKHISVIRLLFAIASFSFAVYLVPGLFGANLSSISGLLPPTSAQKFEITAAPSGSGGAAKSPTMCEEPKYGDILHLKYGVDGYFEYEQGLDCAKELNKPVLLYFTGHACSNCKKMQAEVWSEPGVQKILNEEYVLIALYVDDKKKLPESEWIKSEYDGKMKKTIGQKNADFQITRFSTNTQPYYVVLDPEGNKLTESIGYETDPAKFKKYLENGIDQFKEK